MVKKRKKTKIKDVPKFIGIRLKPIHQTLIKEIMISSQKTNISDVVKQLILDSGYVARERKKRIAEVQVLVNNYCIKPFELTFSNN